MNGLMRDHETRCECAGCSAIASYLVDHDLPLDESPFDFENGKTPAPPPLDGP